MSQLEPMQEINMLDAVASEGAEVHEYDPKLTVPFYPDHAISEATAVFIILSLVSVLCIFFPVILDIKANPMVTPAGSKPEWYYLFLYAFLHFVPPLVGVLAPLVGVGILFFLPFLDRNPERNPRHRIVAITGAILLLAVIGILTIVGYLE